MTDQNRRPDPMTEIDLLAYADGLLDDDPARRAEVERAVAEAPDLADRVRAHISQNEALRRAYAHRLTEAVPERLTAVFDDEARASLPPLRVAAMLCLVVAAGIGGWLLGEVGNEDRWSVEKFLDRSRDSFVTTFNPGLTAAALGSGTTQPLGWLAEEVSIRLKAPDLSEAGYSLVRKDAVRSDVGQIVRLDYAATDGRSLSLFLTPRWEGGREDIGVVRRDGVSIAWWLDGPLASSLMTRLSPREAREAAEAIREALSKGGEGPVVVDPEPASPRPEQDEVMADTLIPPGEALRPQMMRSPPDEKVQQN